MSARVESNHLLCQDQVLQTCVTIPKVTTSRYEGRDGLEPPTKFLTGTCSTLELPTHMYRKLHKTVHVPKTCILFV
jgi:hypothetical protein